MLVAKIIDVEILIPSESSGCTEVSEYIIRECVKNGLNSFYIALQLLLQPLMVGVMVQSVLSVVVKRAQISSTQANNAKEDWLEKSRLLKPFSSH